MTSFQCTNLMVVIKIPDKSNLGKQRFIVAYSSKDFFPSTLTVKILLQIEKV